MHNQNLSLSILLLHLRTRVVSILIQFPVFFCWAKRIKVMTTVLSNETLQDADRRFGGAGFGFGES